MLSVEFSQRRLVDWLVFSFAAVCIAWRPLNDPDIGWHLAGGLWMLDNGGVPDRDFLSALDRPWFAYSWLAEVLYAFVYKLGGFVGLHLLQLFLSLVCFWLLFEVTREAEREARHRFVFGFILSLTVSILFVATVWNLRPQLVSIALWALLSCWILRGEVKLWALTLLMVVWVNVHLYWVLAPATLVLRAVVSVDRRYWLVRALVAALSGVASPYGVGNILGLFGYVFGHEEAYRFISEFQPLAVPLVWMALILAAIVALAIIAILRLGTLTEGQRWLMLVFAVTGLVAEERLKYTPLFGVVCCPALLGVILPGLQGLLGCRMRESGAERVFRLPYPLMVVCVIIPILIAYPFLKPQTPTDDYLELIDLTSRVSQEVGCQGGRRTNILNHFDHGGWIALGFYLSKCPDRDSADLRVAVDGRTLVMTQERLKEFHDVLSRKTSWCEAADAWDADIAILHSSYFKNADNCFTSTKWRERDFGNFPTAKEVANVMGDGVVDDDRPDELEGHEPTWRVFFRLSLG